MEREYKDSGIEWIGTIPETWEVTKLLNVLKSPISDGPHETPSLVENGIPFISVDSLNDSDKVDLSVVRKFISYQDYQEYSKKSKIEKGDILFSKAATIGKTAIVGDETFMVWSPLAIIKTNNNRVNNKFIYHVLNCHRLISYISFLGTYNTQINVGMRALERAIIPLPPLSNQHRIADYLDEKCGEIDSLIALQEQIIEKLKAYKQSVITEAVTKGLDPNAKLVPSGIDWIGEIPEGWKVCRIKDLVIMKSGSNLTSEQIANEGSYPVYGGNGLRGYYEAYSNEGDYVLVGRQGALCGNINYAFGRFWATDHAVVCYPRRNFSLIWFGETLRSMNLGQYSLSAAQPGLSVDRIREKKMPLPPLSEQQTIASYLDEKCADIDRLIALKQQKIETLKDYKKSVIYEAVTGKTFL